MYLTQNDVGARQRQAPFPEFIDTDSIFCKLHIRHYTNNGRRFSVSPIPLWNGGDQDERYDYHYGSTYPLNYLD